MPNFSLFHFSSYWLYPHVWDDYQRQILKYSGFFWTYFLSSDSEFRGLCGCFILYLLTFNDLQCLKIYYRYSMTSDIDVLLCNLDRQSSVELVYFGLLAYHSEIIDSQNMLWPFGLLANHEPWFRWRGSQKCIKRAERRRFPHQTPKFLSRFARTS